MADNNKPTGFTFGSPAAKPAGGFTFGSAAAQSTPAVPSAAPPAFNLTATPSAPATGFAFGSTPATSATSLSFGGLGLTPPAATTAPAAAPLSLGTSLSFGGFGTSKPATATVAAPVASTTATVASGFGSFAAKPPATGGGFAGFSVPAATTAATAAPATTGTTAAPTLPSFGSFAAPPAAASTAASTLTLPTASSAAVSASVATSGVAAPLANLTTSTTTTQSTALSAQPAGQQFNFCQLEEHINKWTLELEEQEKTFTNQATQINAWDRVLIENSDKIVALNEAFEKVKTEQKALEHELEYISAQHSELDECIKPLEKEMSKNHQFDPEREQTYLLAESLDTQLKQMGEDLKEVIEHLNEANKDRDPNDPIVQIGKILNAHMSSLQWIENSTSHITSKLEDITKLQETLKRDNERSFRLN